MQNCKLPWKRLSSIYREDYNTIAEDHHRQAEYIDKLCRFLESKGLFLEYLETIGKEYEKLVQKEGISSDQN